MHTFLVNRQIQQMIFIFFLIGKRNKYIKKDKETTRGNPKAYRKYTKVAQRVIQQKRKENKKPTSPHLQPFHFKKSNKEQGPSTIHVLVHDQKLQRREIFILCNEKTASSNTILYLSYHTDHKRQRGVVIQAFLRFLSTKVSCLLKRVSLTIKGKTQLTPTRAKTMFHKILAFDQ